MPNAELTRSAGEFWRKNPDFTSRVPFSKTMMCWFSGNSEHSRFTQNRSRLVVFRSIEAVLDFPISVLYFSRSIFEYHCLETRNRTHRYTGTKPHPQEWYWFDLQNLRRFEGHGLWLDLHWCQGHSSRRIPVQAVSRKGQNRGGCFDLALRGSHRWNHLFFVDIIPII